MKATAESHARRNSTLNRDYLKVSGDLEVTQRQLDQVQSLYDTQNLMIKRLQEQLGKDADFDPDMDPHVRRVHRDYEGRIDEYEERTVTQEERTRLQLHSSVVTVEIVSLQQELEDSRAATASARVTEEAGRLQLARMFDDQLAQNKTIENLRRQVETSNTAVRDAQAALRLNQDQLLQQQRMSPPDWD